MSGVGIVVVSHSRLLARAAVDLASQMTTGRDLRLAVAAGLDESTIGTDAMQIKTALEEVDGVGGVVVLMDLGSAVLSAELAVELLDDVTARDRIILSPAPVVEGLVAAAVAAAGGAPREEVAAEAAAALRAKQEHLGTTSGTTSGTNGDAAGRVAVGSARDADVERHAEITVANAHGLHARPVARLVALARGLTAQLTVVNLTTGAGPAAATSPTQLASLGAAHGHRLRVEARGERADQALDAVLALARSGFGDEPGTPAPWPSGTFPGAAADGVAQRPGPQAVSAGIGIGPARFWRDGPSSCSGDGSPTRGGATGGTHDPEAELRRLHVAREGVRRVLGGLTRAARAELGASEATIFVAHEGILDDPALVDATESAIRSGLGAEAAWAAAVTAAEEAYASLTDPYLRERGHDVRAVGDQVLGRLTGVAAGAPSGAGVLVIRDLTPAQAAGLDPAVVSAVVLAHGSASSHAAVLVRARGIPAVAGAGDEVLPVREGTTLVVDGTAGRVLVDPAPEVLDGYRARAAEEAGRAARERSSAAGPAVTRDGRTVLVEANLGSVQDAVDAVRLGADGAGLVRTEFLFLDRDDEPGVDEQEHLYRSIAEALCGRRATFRTLDVGGDKPLPYLRSEPEANPFLGVRGVRLALARPQLLRAQLTALVRVAREHPLGVMVPMVSGPGELQAVHRLLDEVLTAEAGGVRPSGLELGVMIEVPAAALKAAAFAGVVDFVSIGTNDLTQYTLAAERGHAALSALDDALDPGVLRLVRAVCLAGAGRFRVGVCGEAAADILAGPVFAALGVTELSVGPNAVPAVKARCREVDLAALADRVEACLALPDAAAVRSALGAALSRGR